MKILLESHLDALFPSSVILLGAANGESLQKRLNLVALNQNSDRIVLVFPLPIIAVTNSFFHGLLNGIDVKKVEIEGRSVVIEDYHVYLKSC